ncbi:YggS family pyridoxal phosphate-dependent enzyme [Peptococcaceae bacterium 1198_IL3148]
MVSNYKIVQQKIREAALRSGRDPERIKLIAVTKTVPVEEITKVIKAGASNLGENRVQELVNKQVLLSDVHWHLIGHLQTNKVNKIIGKTVLIHSLDRWSLAETLQQAAEKRDITVNVLVQVNVSGEQSKYGLAPQQVEDFIGDVSELSRLNIMGLMTMAPFVSNPEETRPVFRELYNMQQKLQIKWPNLKHLSMGMTNDYQIAVEEGADIVRVGSAIFKHQLLEG